MPNKHDAVVCEVSEDKYVSRISSASDAMTYDSVADRVLDHLYLISDIAGSQCILQKLQEHL